MDAQKIKAMMNKEIFNKMNDQGAAQALREIFFREGTIKSTDPIRAARMRIELSLLRDILGEDLPQEYLRPIKEQTWD